MQKDALIEMIDMGEDVEFEYHGHGYTIVGSNAEGPLIAEWFTEENKKVFKNGKDLVEGYVIDGKKLVDILDEIE